MESVPGPWFTHRTNWRGEPVEHDIYISGNEHECHDDEDDEEVVTGSVCTSVAIVPGNATSRKITKATADLIVAAPFAREILEEIRDALEQRNGRETSRVTRDELAPALKRIQEWFRQVDGVKACERTARHTYDSTRF